MTPYDPDRPNRKLIVELTRQYEQVATWLREQLVNPPGKSAGAQEWNSNRAAAILAQVDQQISELKASATKWTGSAIDKSMAQGVAAADDQALGAGIRPEAKGGAALAGTFHGVDRRAVEVLAQDTVRDLHGAAVSMRRQAETALRRMAATGVTNDEVNTILTGGLIEGRPDQAIRGLREALRKVHGKVVTVIDKNGDPIEFKVGQYAAMVARTKTRQAVVQARHQRLTDTGLDLVVVIGRQSENFCTAYLGQVFSISGEHPDYPPLASLPGGGPPFHPNCSKGTAPFVEALRDPEEIEAGRLDPTTERMLNIEDRTELQHRFKALQAGRRAQRRERAFRRDAGRREATHAGDDPGFQEHRIRELGVKRVQLHGRSDIGVVALRGMQQVVSAGGTLPNHISAEPIVVDGEIRPSVIGRYFPRSKKMVFNTAWPGWSDDGATARAEYEQGKISSPSPFHAIYHEAAHEELLSRGVNHRKARFALAADREVARSVSKRAAHHKDEFLAEVRAARMAGYRFDHEVMALYRKLGGT